MGLDMYAYKVPVESVIDDFHFFEDNPVEIAYWRKRPNLHGFIKSIYENKSGDNGSFNRIPVRLTDTDINLIEEAVLADKLPYTTGFFFGKSLPEDKQLDLEFIKNARQALSEGFAVYYHACY